MGTRGLYGLRMNGVDKLSYNHYDSYPEVLGRMVAAVCHYYPAEQIRECFERLIPFHDKRDLPENAVVVKEPMDLISDSELRYYDSCPEFIMDSLDCEFAYIINLDEEVLEFWKGNQLEPDFDNRYGHYRNRYGYYPCKRMTTFPLSELLDGRMDTVVEEMIRLYRV